MNRDKKAVALLIILVVALTTITVRITYSLFEVSKTNNTISGSSCFDISYTKGQNIDGELSAGSSYSSGFNTDIKFGLKSSCNAVGVGTIYLTTKSTSTMDFTDNALRYTVVVGSTVVSTGAVNGTTNQVIYDNINVVNSQVTYKVYVWLDESLENQTNYNDEVYEGFIHASVTATSDINS